eukprot:GABV01000325.1.p1 GENE.GABV01000325.1~~GABV01000325.1.p1  ORF type:complete len:480 (-),score=177.80 GABV01000325.1:5-1414(-)
MSAFLGGNWVVSVPVPGLDLEDDEPDADRKQEKHENVVPFNKPPERVWCLIHKEHTKKDVLHAADEFARRPLILVGPDEGIVMFDTKESRSMLNYAIMALRCPIHPDNVIWVPYRPDFTGVINDALTTIAEKAPGASVVVRSPSPRVVKLIGELGLRLDNDLDLPNKEWLHSKDRGLKHTVQLRDPKTGKSVNLHKPYGWTAFDKETLLKGYDALREKLGPEGKLVAKYTELTAGTGVTLDVDRAFVEKIEPSKASPVVLEEMLVADRLPGYETKYENAPSVHYIGKDRYGEICSQLSLGQFFNGVASPAIGMPKALSSEIHAVCRAISRQFKFQSTWGLDFMVCKGKPYLIDLNFGRLNNTHYAKMFLDLHDLLDLPFRSFKREIPVFDNGMTSIWAHLLSRGLAFSPETHYGVAVLAFDNGIRASFVAIASTPEEVIELQHGVDDWLSTVRAAEGAAAAAPRPPDQQ